MLRCICGSREGNSVREEEGGEVGRERERETRKEVSIHLCVLLAGASADLVQICVRTHINTCIRAHLQLLLVVATAGLLAPDRRQIDNVLLLFLIHAFEPSRLAFGCAPPGLPAGRRRLPLCGGRCVMNTFSFVWHLVCLLYAPDCQRRLQTYF
jgi:hypothetical protein